MSDDGLTPPTAAAIDRAHTITAAALSAVPIAGGPAAELFGAIVPTSLERRKRRWAEEVATRLRALEAERGVSIEDLAGDEAFVSLLIEASKIALGTHLEEKLQLLGACIESCAIPEERDDFMAMRMLRWVDELSPEHFVVLSYLANPRGWFEKHGLEQPNLAAGSPWFLMQKAQLGIDEGVLEVVALDLRERGLGGESLHVMMTDAGAWSPRSTGRGEMLLRFVKLLAGPAG